MYPSVLSFLFVVYTSPQEAACKFTQPSWGICEDDDDDDDRTRARGDDGNGYTNACVGAGFFYSVLYDSTWWLLLDCLCDKSSSAIRDILCVCVCVCSFLRGFVVSAKNRLIKRWCCAREGSWKLDIRYSEVVRNKSCISQCIARPS